VSSVYDTLHGSLQLVLLQRLGWSSLRDVQEQTYHAVVSGDDVLVIAPTAGGKTEAALIPVIDRILKEGSPGVAALYISPLKALINDQEERFVAFCTPTGLDVTKWHGDVPKGDRAWPEGEPPHLLMITPESLEVLLLERILAADLRHLQVVIIDEVHAFMESERGAHLVALLDRLDQIAGNPVQRIGLSATVGNPEGVLAWMASGRCGRTLVRVPVPARQKQFSFIVEPDDERRTDAIVRIVTGKKALVFMNSRSDAEVLTGHLRGRVRDLAVHHSSLSPQARHAAEDAFSRAGSACIICTSTLELGIDIGDLDVVVQVGPPPSVSSFLQRMGRSGRRGRPPYVACILKNPCELLCMAAVIECASRKEVEVLVPMKRPCNVLMQQLFLAVYREGRVSRRRLASFLLLLAPFREIPEAALKKIVNHLVGQEFLVTDGDMLMLGPAAERSFGRSNWKDLFSVIAGGGEYRAVTPDGEVVGRLDARFVSSRQGGSFSLGGQNWRLVKADADHERVVVLPGGDQGSRIFWTGGQSGFSPLVCAEVLGIISRKGTSLPMSERETHCLSGLFSRLPPGIRPDGIHLWEQPGIRGPDVVIFTCRGRNFNRILRAVMNAVSRDTLSSRYDDFSVIIHTTPKAGGIARIVSLVQDIQERSPEELGALLPGIPPDRWKFGAAMPAFAIRAMTLADWYRIDWFHEQLAGSAIRILRGAEEPDTGGMQEE
jgi:ATP-dependent Lhr-like helicase